jgi:hypothetical protein
VVLFAHFASELEENRKSQCFRGFFRFSVGRLLKSRTPDAAGRQAIDRIGDFLFDLSIFLPVPIILDNGR